MLTVYLSNNTIQAVTGKKSGKGVQVDNYYTIIDTDGCIINGTVTNEQAFIDLMERFFSNNELPRKDVTLVINSTQFVTKLIEAPLLNKKSSAEFIKNEFASVERTSEPVYAYHVLDENRASKTRTVLACSVDKSFITNYIDIFAKLGVEINGIYSSLNCAIKFLDAAIGEKKSSIIQLFGEMELTSVLFVEGQYQYSSRLRIFEDRETPAFATEVASGVGNILQFVKANQIEAPVREVLLCGVSSYDASACKNAICATRPDILVTEIDLSSAISASSFVDIDKAKEFFFPVAALIMNPKEADLTESVKSTKKENVKLKQISAMAKPVIISFVIVATIIALMTGYRLFLNVKLSRIKSFTQDEKNISVCEEYDDVQAQIDTLSSYLNSVKTTKQNTASFPVATSSVNKVLSRCAEGYCSVSVISYDSETGVLSINSSAKNVEKINKFIQLLKQESIFYRITYTGYVYSDIKDSWSVNVVCYLAENIESSEAIND